MKSPERTATRVRAVVALFLVSAVVAVPWIVRTDAMAAIVPKVPMGTASTFAVLGASTVTNTGNTVLDGSLGLWPGTSITGFPPGIVLPPGTTETTTAAAQQGQSDLTAAYNDAAGRPLDAITPADLANQNLQGGVYAGPNKGPLSLTGPLTLDGAGDLNSVFIFQTDSTLTTATGSTVTLINGAQECNVFWQVGSSATLGSGSVLVGNVLAAVSVTVNSTVTVRGRALALTGAVTLNNDTFTEPTCAQAPPGTTTALPGTTTTTLPATTTTTLSGTTTTTLPATTTTTLSGTTTTTLSGTTTTTLPATTTTASVLGATTTQPGGSTTTDSSATTSSTTPGVITRVPAVPAVPTFTG